MKIRVGFVSNSSSVSFCIYGIWIDHPQETLQDFAEVLELFCHWDQYGNGLYIGRKWSNIGDNETGGQFKKTTQEKVNKLPVDSKECKTQEEGWYDG